MASAATPALVAQRLRKGRWSLAWVALSSVAVAAYFAGQYAQGTLTTLAHNSVGVAPVYATRPWPVQFAFYCHIAFAGLALALGPWQFSSRLRGWHPRVHRGTGRAYLITVALGSVSAFVMSMFNSVGLLGFFGFGSLAVLWGWTAWRAYRSARERDFRSHQAWAIRNFALTYAAVTLRLEFGALVLAQLPFTHGQSIAEISAQAYAPLPFVAWLPNLVIAEFMIRRRGLPALRIASPANPRLSGS